MLGKIIYRAQKRKRSFALHTLRASKALPSNDFRYAKRLECESPLSLLRLENLIEEAEKAAFPDLSDVYRFLLDFLYRFIRYQSATAIPQKSVKM